MSGRSRFCIHVLAAAALLLAATGANVWAQSAPSSDSNLGSALLYGKAAAVNRLAAKEQVNPLLVDVMNAQLDFNLPRLLSLALKCRDAAFKAGAAQTALYCSSVAQGAARDLGDSHSFFQIEYWIKRFGFHAYNRTHSIPLHAFGNGLDDVDLRRLAKVTAPLSVSLSNGPETVPYVHSLTSAHQYELRHGGKPPPPHSLQLFLPTVQMNVNGMQVAAVVDTGTPRTIVMDKSAAGTLGVTVLVRGVEPMHSSIGPKPSARNGALGLIKSLSFGSLTLRNVLVFVTPDSQIPVAGGVIVGAPLLARFDSVTFGKSALFLNTDSSGCLHPLRMTFASLPNESGRLVFPATSESQRVNASLDTGTVRPLTASAKLAPHTQAPADSTGGGPQHDSQRIRYWPLLVFADSATFNDTKAEIIQGMPPPVDVYLGAPYLTTADFTLTFGDKPSLCIVSRNHSS